MYHAHFPAIIGVKPFTVVVFYVGGSVELDAAFAAHHALDFAIGLGADIGGRGRYPAGQADAVGIVDATRCGLSLDLAKIMNVQQTLL